MSTSRIGDNDGSALYRPELAAGAADLSAGQRVRAGGSTAMNPLYIAGALVALFLLLYLLYALIKPENF